MPLWDNRNRVYNRFSSLVKVKSKEINKEIDKAALNRPGASVDGLPEIG